MLCYNSTTAFACGKELHNEAGEHKAHSDNLCLAYIPVANGVARINPDKFYSKAFGAVEDGKIGEEKSWFF